MRAQLPEPGRFRNEKEIAEHVLAKLSTWFNIEREVRGHSPTGESVRIDAIAQPKDLKGWKAAAPALGIEFKMPGAFTGYDEIAQAVSYTHCRWEGYEKVGIFLCPGPLSYFVERHHQESARRQERLGPEELDRHRQDVRNYGLQFGKVYTDRHVEYEARKRHREALADLRYEDFLARAEGFDNLAAHDSEVALRVRTELINLIGHLGVGELMPYEGYGWTFSQSGKRIWSQEHGVTGVRWALGPQIGSRRR